MPRKTAEQAQQTRDKILKGALNVFSQKGFSRTTLRDIAKHIGMTRGAVYWHFKDKQDLMIELIKSMHQREKELLDQVVPVVDSLDSLLDSFLARVEFLEKDRQFRKYVLFMTLQVEWQTEKQIMDAVKLANGPNSPFNLAMTALIRANEKG